MPITRRQFDLEITDTGEGFMRSVYEWLASHRDQAYTAKEIAVQVGVDPTILDRNFSRAIAVLVEVLAVKTRNVDFDTYYAFSRETDTATWAETLPSV